MTIILGSSGRLGSAIHASNTDALCPARSIYRNWHAPESVDLIKAYLKQNHCEEKVAFVCTGILNPELDEKTITEVNFLTPCNVITAAKDLGWSVVTFGTILETSAVDNAYVRSKRQLASFITKSGFEHVTHIRLHTLYGGGPPSPNMFLGQILSTLMKGSEFAMTSGRQLREYHHVDDDALAIKSILNSSCEHIIDLNSGISVTLSELATAVFTAVNRIDLLRIGALADPEVERFEIQYARHNDLAEFIFRDPLKAVPTYIKNLLDPTSCQR